MFAETRSMTRSWSERTARAQSMRENTVPSGDLGGQHTGAVMVQESGDANHGWS